MSHPTAKKTVFITGANRGIGLGLARAFLAGGHSVIAAARHPDGSRELWELEADFKSRCRIVQLDVTSDEDLARLPAAAPQPIDLLVNNAGILLDREGEFAKADAEALLKSFAVNAVAPLRVAQRLLPALLAAPKPVAAFMSSRMGSLADNRTGGYYAYRMSKAALNMLTRSLAADFKQLTAVALHPGWVQTEMGGSGATTSIDESTAGLVKVLLGLTTKDSGRFLDFRGAEVPW
jgi:NAD(P)-dependent dehydrogenase (short-subunit alcohol dehydrogenase family)